jgi:hypothetical protein
LQIDYGGSGVQKEVDEKRIPPLINKIYIHDRQQVTVIIVANQPADLESFKLESKKNLDYKTIDAKDLQKYVVAIPPVHLGERSKMLKQRASSR